MTVSMEIDPAYAPLIGEHSRFWRLPAVEARLGGDGVKFKLGSLANLLRGGIEFANLPGSARSNQALYANRDEATHSRHELVLTAASNPGLASGTPVRHRGVTIGEIHDIALAPGLGRVEFKVMLREPYAARFLRRGAGYQLVQAKLGLTGTAHLDTLIKGAYIEATPGSGKESRRFELLSRAPDGLKLLLTSAELRGVSVGAPILFRKVVVGQVESIRLARDGSQVETRISIDPDYGHLVREGSRFWNVSGLKADIGLTGGTLEVETVQSLIAGGIAFATPVTAMGNRVRNGQRFALYPEPEKEWLGWRPSLSP